MITKTITVYDLNRFEKKLASLNRKVVKMGLQTIRQGQIVEEKKTVKNSFGESVEVFSHYEVEVILREEIVQFPGGWGLVGVIDHTENLVRSVPDYKDVPLRHFVERGSVCEHCGLDRVRNETFIVVDKVGRFKQVGRDCVGQLLGIAPERALGQIEVVREVLEDEEWLGGRQVDGYHLGFYLSHVAAAVRAEGWRSRSAVKEDGFGRATADIAWENIRLEQERKRNRYGDQLWIDRTEADKELAERVAKWLEGLVEREGLNDYLANLRQIGQNGFVTAKSSGFAASALVAFQKEEEQAIKRAAERAGRPVSQYVGRVGERTTFERLTLVKSIGFDNEYGVSFIHRFLDDHGNVVVWKTGVELDQNVVYKVKATVKAQEEYRGERQTVVTRAKVEKLEEVA